ncbi:MAG TPA: hypothetical protein VKU00_15165 [Chthonomonadaceae bacterium]|nr:hypothetical protein [Chthonomonadaceae bacterium]
MKHATLLAAIIASALLGAGAIGAVVYHQMQGDMIQNGKKVGTFGPSEKFPGVTVFTSTPDKMQNGTLELKRSDGGPSTYFYVEKNK